MTNNDALNCHLLKKPEKPDINTIKLTLYIYNCEQNVIVKSLPINVEFRSFFLSKNFKFFLAFQITLGVLVETRF